ncbi:DUF5666 domain-containing protein [Inmirania thermothiophila]|uniref:DUF5666 domain-containing protein n=1 Tax=Inmirania thermothiophila TaxID=1750597 RepID=A0A3N1YBH7_9GAMM|nr:DUF5666 domain-containing protein [Inmirania thermothiophila]ROR35012.1 hypothetical protein EDC57_0929 [Inmirania thermothiophila]
MKKHMQRHIRRAGTWTAVAASAALLAACGGGGGSADGGTPTTVASQGVITQLGSIWVNGVHWDDSGAAIEVDDNPSGHEALRVGMVVTVEGTMDDSGNAVATRVVFDDELKGPVSGLDPAAGTFAVLGQTVHTSPDGTVFHDTGRCTGTGSGLAALADGNVVEVSGHRNAAGEVEATYVECKAPDLAAFATAQGKRKLELRATVTADPDDGATFQVGTQTVDYREAVVDDGMPPHPWSGTFVEVKCDPEARADDGIGDVTDCIDGSGVLHATKVEPAMEGLGDVDADEVEIEGFVTDFAGPSDFEVAGQPVDASGNVRFVDGTAADLADGVRVEVEGQLSAGGVLVAHKVKFKGGVRLTGVAQGGAIMGIAVTGDTLTDGQAYEVRGRWTGSAVSAVRAEPEDGFDPDDWELRAPASLAQGIADPVFELLGVQVDTTNATFEAEDDVVLTRAGFFARLTNGTGLQSVKVKGSYDGGVLTARKVEFDD